MDESPLKSSFVGDRLVEAFYSKQAGTLVVQALSNWHDLRTANKIFDAISANSIMWLPYSRLDATDIGQKVDRWLGNIDYRYSFILYDEVANIFGTGIYIGKILDSENLGSWAMGI